MKFRSRCGDARRSHPIARFAACASILLILPASSRGQADTSGVPDTLGARDVERMLEGSVQSENSPVLDFLPPQREEETVHVESRTRLMMPLQRSEGYRTGAYPGSSLKTTQRLRLSDGGRFSGGVIMEKDAGESRVNDFTAGHVAVSGMGILTSAVVGDFYIESGQGVALWRSADLGKGSDVILSARRSGGGVKPFLSASESGFLRGCAAEVTLGPVDALAFYSRTPRSGSTDSAGRVTSLYTSGYFRTESERRKRNVLSEVLGGMRLAGHAPNIDAGLTWFRDAFTRPLLLGRGEKFSGDRYEVLSCDYVVGVQDLALFGEWAASRGAVAGSCGIRVPAGRRMEVVAAFRQYPLSFFALHGLGFGERAENERGVYVGMLVKVLSHVRVGAYYDRFGAVDAESGEFPTSGSDLLAELDALPLPRVECNLRYQLKVTRPGESARRKHSMRVSVSYRFSKEITVRGRLDRVAFSIESASRHETGMAACQEIIYTVTRGISFNARIAWFATDSYDCAVYEYERDLPGIMTMPVLNGSGTRWYLLLRYKATAQLDISAKYSDFLRDDLRRLGTGLDELPANHDNRIGVQVDLRL